ncbi:hypothetical protein NN6n1_35650 [Shinella zoogloeoides]
MSFPAFTDLENTILDEIRGIPKGEAHVFMSDDGNTVLHREEHVGPGGVIPADLEQRLTGGEKMRLLHNHPSGGSLSMYDIHALVRFPDVLEIVVVTPTRTIYRAAASAWQAARLDSMRQPLIDVSTELGLLVRPGIIDDDDLRIVADRYPRHLLCHHLHAKSLLEYSASLSAEDNSNMRELAGTPIIRRWIDELEARIK